MHAYTSSLEILRKTSNWTGCVACPNSFHSIPFWSSFLFFFLYQIPLVWFARNTMMSNFSLSIFYTYTCFLIAFVSKFFSSVRFACTLSLAQCIDEPFFLALKKSFIENNNKHWILNRKWQKEREKERIRNRTRLWKTRAHKIGASSSSSCHHHQHRLLMWMAVHSLTRSLYFYLLHHTGVAFL